MLTPYPQIVEYNEAVQNPATAFRDTELRQGRVAVNALGLPVVLSGGFALTYRMAAPRRTLALRCFHREIPAAQQKYAAIAEALRGLHSPYFVGFDYVPDGIRIRGGFYPVLKMEWAEGEPLGVWLGQHGGDRRAVERLRDSFAALAAFLEESGVAHGDIQNGNVIISPGGLKLVDYDGMYVPGMPPAFGCETGHKHFQHPDRGVGHFGPTIDRFSFIAVDLSLAALVEDPSLYRRFRHGGEAILFRANDFADPERSEVFRALQQHAGLREPAGRFAAICRGDIAAIPTLAEFRSGRNIPPAQPAPARMAAQPASSRGSAYIAPFPVVNAEDFAAVARCVGQRIELVGRVVGVRTGIAAAERGRVQGRPCVVVDFAPPAGDGAEVTLCADGAELPRDAPDDGWVGRWVSVVGLIDPPRVEQHFWSRRTRVGVTTASPHEIELLPEQEAQFRLRRGGRAEQTAPPAAPAAAPAPAAVGNRQLVSQLLRKSGGSPPPRPAAPPVAPPGRSNRAIVGALRRATASRAPAVPRAQPSGAARPLPQAAPRSVSPKPPPAFIPPRAHAAVAPARSAVPASATPAIPKSGSFVIHPKNRKPRRPPVAPPPAEETVWQRVLRFFGVVA